MDYTSVQFTRVSNGGINASNFTPSFFFLALLSLLTFEMHFLSLSLLLQPLWCAATALWSPRVFSSSDPTLPPKQFKVKIKSTIASKRCKLAGEYLMSSETEALVLFSLDASDAIFRWPYRLLRRFGKVEVMCLQKLIPSLISRLPVLQLLQLQSFALPPFFVCEWFVSFWVLLLDVYS